MRRIDFLALLTRLFLGYLFMSSGLCKLTDGQFSQLMGPPLFIKALTPYGLKGFALFIAASQVLVGALVLSQRYSLLGLVALMPINVCILVVTISQNWSGTPYVDAVFVLLNALVLLYEWNTLKVFVLPEEARRAVPPLTNQLFPNQWLPLGVIGMAGLASIIARYNADLTIIPALACFGLTFANVWSSQALLRLDRVVLALSLVGILSVTLAKRLQATHINGMQVFAVCVLINLCLVAVTCWQSRRRAITSPSTS